jgi:DNA repair protein RadC
MRLRRRFVSAAPGSFEDHELVELLLFYCIPRKDTNPTAHKLLSEFGGIDRLFEANEAELRTRGKMNEAGSILVKLVPEIAKRIDAAKKQSKRIDFADANKAGEYAVTLFRYENRELFYALYLNARSSLIARELISHGTVDGVLVDPRKIAESAIRQNASRVIIAHNHPGGLLAASEEDIFITMKIREVLKCLDIELTDHIIECESEYLSFRGKGIL